MWALFLACSPDGRWGLPSLSEEARVWGDSGASPPPLIDPVGLGVEVDGGVGPDGDLLPHRANGHVIDPSMTLVVVGRDYLDQGVLEDRCEFVASPLDATVRDCDLVNDEGANTWFSYEAVLHLTFSDCEFRLDPLVYAELAAAFEGMHVGWSFGPLSPYLESMWDPATRDQYRGAMNTMYVSLVAPDGSFVGDDWTTAFSWQWDPGTGEVALQGGMFLVSQDVDRGFEMASSYVTTTATYYQDLSRLDLAVLDDPAGEPCDCTPDPGDDGPGSDTDGDGTCDRYDDCVNDAPDDPDLDGRCQSLDPCPLDRANDSDGDGACDSDDPCPADNPDDVDGDGVCTSDDPCPADNPDDPDGDGVCPADDRCPQDFPDDTDGDGVCDSDDACPRDRPNDVDGDGVCNSEDPCPLDAPDDPDGDGVCSHDDACPLDDPDDPDRDGVCTSDDPCPLDPLDDLDHDGVCDSEDPCPLDAPDDTDGDGLCDHDDPTPEGDDPPTDGATPGGTPDADPPDGEGEASGCGCATTGTGSAGALLAAGLLVARRRRVRPGAE